MKSYIKRIISYSEVQFIYNIFMMLAALTAVICVVWQMSSSLTAAQATIVKGLETVIWLLFTIDYLVRLYLAEQKSIFAKRNIIDLLAIIPLDMIFQGLRIFAYASRLYKRMDKFINQNSFNLVLWLTFIIIFCGAIAISYIEGMPINDAIWWAFVTATTVGYGDISPSSTAGRLVAVILMLVGIGFIGVLTGNIATYFLNKQETKYSYKSEILDNVVNKLHHFDQLSPDDVNDICKVLKALKNPNN